MTASFRRLATVYLAGDDNAVTRLAIDAHTAWRVLHDDRRLDLDLRLVGPAALKSQLLSLLYRACQAGEVTEPEARTLLTRIAELRIRLLGDRVSRFTAFQLATEFGWEDTAVAEILAVAVLQADALVTSDPVLSTAAAGRIRIAGYEELFTDVA